MNCAPWRAFRSRLCLIAAFALSHVPVADAAPHRPLNSIVNLDRQTSQILLHLSQGELDDARLLARMLAWRFPDFALGHLLSGELESMAALDDVLLASDKPIDPDVVELLLEAQVRLTDKKIDNQQDVPFEIVQAGRDASQIILVDLGNATLYQFDTSAAEPTLIGQHYAGSGKAGFGKIREGDNKTPLGVYSINDHRADASLPELYGSGALTLNYPNALDTFLGRTGYGIWLHGVPRSGLSRSPRSSEGCVTMSNEHLTRLVDRIDLHTTQVIMTDQIRWVDSASQRNARRQFRELFSQYQHAWLQGDEKELQALYSHPTAAGRSAGSAAKLALGKIAKTIEHLKQPAFLKALTAVNADDISILRSPGPPLEGESEHTYENDFVITSARFGVRDEMQLTIYWGKTVDNRWHVVAEHIDTVFMSSPG